VPRIFLQAPSSGLMTHLMGSFQNLKTKEDAFQTAVFYVLFDCGYSPKQGNSFGKQMCLGSEKVLFLLRHKLVRCV